MSDSKGSLADLAVQKVEQQAFAEDDRAVIVLGTGSTRQVFLFIGPSDEKGFVAFCRSEVHEAELDGYIAGLFMVWKKGSSFQQARSVTAETGGTVCVFELGKKLCLEIEGKGAHWIEEPISSIYFHSSKQ